MFGNNQETTQSTSNYVISDDPESEFMKILLEIKPPNENEIDDESDIEMDNEVFNACTNIPHIASNEFDDFIFEEDEDESAVKNKNEIEKPSIVNLDVTIEDMFNELFGVKKSEDDNHYVEMIFNDPAEGWKELINIELDLDLSTALFNISARYQDFSRFILKYSFESGLKGTRVLANIPALPINNVNNFLMSRKDFAIKYPMFEGNFSLAEFTKNNKGNPPPLGEPPVSINVVRDLESLLDLLLIALRSNPSNILAMNGVSIYQASSYVIAKMKQFKINLSFLETNIIPLNKNQHMLLKKAFEQAELNIPFPSDPFNYNDPMIIKRLRPPQSRNIYN